MNLFSDFMDRFKAQVGVSKDKEVAELLGLSITAFAERKRRESIPIKEVFNLAAERPALGLDPDWIVSGVSKHFETNDITERHLVECYRIMSHADRKVISRIASSLSGVVNMASSEITHNLSVAYSEPANDQHQHKAAQSTSDLNQAKDEK